MRFQWKSAVLMALAVIGVACVFIASFLLDNVFLIVVFAAGSAGLVLVDAIFSCVAVYRVQCDLAERCAELEAEDFRALASDQISGTNHIPMTPPVSTERVLDE